MIIIKLIVNGNKKILSLVVFFSSIQPGMVKKIKGKGYFETQRDVP